MSGRKQVATVTESAVLNLPDLVALTGFHERTLRRAAQRDAIPGRVKAARGARTRPHRYSRRLVEEWIDRGMPGLLTRRQS